MATYVSAARYRAISAFTASQRTRAEALTDLAVNAAIFELLGGLSRAGLATGRFGLTGLPFSCVLPDGATMAVSVQNENGKVDLNAAQPDLIAALVKGVMPGDRNASALVRSLLRGREAEKGDAAGPTFVSALELEQVPGIDHRLFLALAPMVTVHSGSPGLNARLAPAALLAAVSGSVGPAEAERRSSAFFLAGVPGRTVLIAGAAATPSGIGFSRAAIVEFTVGPPPSYRIREWREGLTVVEPSAKGWPAC